MGYNKIITLQQYKNDLINKFNDRASVTEMGKVLNERYKDELFKNTIIGTYKAVENILYNNDINDEYGYCFIELENENIINISLNVSGGFFSDEIYTDINGNLVSDYILKYIFGEQLSIQFNCDLMPYSTDPDICTYDEHYYLYLSNISKQKIDEIKEKLLNKSGKILKKIQD